MSRIATIPTLIPPGSHLARGVRPPLRRIGVFTLVGFCCSAACLVLLTSAVLRAPPEYLTAALRVSTPFNFAVMVVTTLLLRLHVGREARWRSAPAIYRAHP